MGASDPLRPALGFPDPASWAPWRKRFPLRPASGVGKYLPWLSISPARPNKLFTIFIVCSMFCGRWQWWNGSVGKDPPPGREISACDLTKGTRDPESWCLGHDNGVNAHFRRHIFISFRLSAPPSLAVCPRITSSWLVLPLVLRRRRMKCNSLNFIVQRFPLTSPWVRLQFNLLLRQENLIYCPCTGNFSAELETHKNKSKNKSTSKRTQNHN